MCIYLSANCGAVRSHAYFCRYSFFMHTQKTTPVTAEETPVVALSLVQPTKKRQHAHRIHMNKLMYILLRCALSANTKNSRVVVLTGSSPSEHVAMLAH